MRSRTLVAMASAVVPGALLANDPARGDPPADFACTAGEAHGISPIMSIRADQIVSLWRRSTWERHGLIVRSTVAAVVGWRGFMSIDSLTSAAAFSLEKLSCLSTTTCVPSS